MTMELMRLEKLSALPGTRRLADACIPDSPIPNPFLFYCVLLAPKIQSLSLSKQQKRVP